MYKRQIPYHRYIRSDVPNNISKDEIDWLYKNNFTTIIDLRSDWEHEHESVPLEIDNRFIYHHKPVTIDGLVDIDNINGIVPKTVADVSKSYILMADKNMKNIINTILNAKTNVLYFCSAGKYRTGVVSAILMLIYKESRNSIIDDYMKSLEMCIRDSLHYLRIICFKSLFRFFPVRYNSCAPNIRKRN